MLAAVSPFVTPCCGSYELERIDHEVYGLGMKLDDIKEAIEPACRDFDVQRLDVFGSVARGTSTQASDLDLLVEFRDPAREPAKRFFGLLHRIEDTFGCRVDLLTRSGLRNPYFRKRILGERIPLYGA